MHLKQKRHSLNLKLKDICEKLNCSASTIYKIEKGGSSKFTPAYMKLLGFNEIDITKFNSGSMNQIDIEECIR